jgi:3-isopropylmalate/(R)-2-methylmalate dehydratase small subunit
MRIDGRARVFGDDVNTDYIISSTRKRASIDPVQLAPFLFESTTPGFAATVEPGDVLVAGRNFGCGSAMEVAATVILAAGIRAVIARSFARSFYRNAINNGLPVVECDTSAIREGDRLSVRFEAGQASVHNITRRAVLTGSALPPIMLEILEHGGIVGFLAKRGGWDLPR